MTETADEALVEAAGDPGIDIPHFLALSLYRFAYRSGRRLARLYGRSPFGGKLWELWERDSVLQGGASQTVRRKQG